MEESNPYEAPKAGLNSLPTEVDPDAALLAARGARLLASIIDSFVLLCITLPLTYFSGHLTAVMVAARSGQQMPLGETLLWGAIGFALFAAVQGVPLSRNGQTWGKLFLRIRISHLDGSKPTLGTLLLKRYFPTHAVGMLPFAGGILGIANVLLIFRADRRCGHDFLAGTRVVRID